MDKDKKNSKVKFMNSRGQVQYFLENAFRVGFLVIALLVFFLLINFYITNKIDTVALQANVLNARILYSDAIMKTDSDLRVHPGIIDLKKFNDDSLKYNINYPTPRHATAKLELFNNVDGSSVRVAYLNKDAYEKLEVLAKSNADGKGSATSYFKVYPVTYYDGTAYNYGTIHETIIVPNS